MPSIVVVGGFFGDEGKGKIIAYLSKKDNYSIAVRGGVGPNAGHTFEMNGQVFKVRMLPSAVLNDKTRLMIGSGVLVNIDVLLNEIATFSAENRTFIDYNCGIINKNHIDKDKQDSNLKDKIGTTGTGTGPANAERILRTMKLANEYDSIRHFTTNVSDEVNLSLDKNQSVLIEGTQGTFLSLYHGTYPYVTSKDVTASAICSDVGIGPKRVDDVMVVFKSYVTRVGSGPLENELDRNESKQRGWTEYGSVTGRERRSAPFNFDMAKKAVKINSATQIAITKLDILFPENKGVTDYNKLSTNAKKYVEEIQSELGTKVTIIGTGSELDETIDLRTTTI